MSEEEKWGEFERIASCEHEPSHEGDGARLFLVCEDIRDRILALSRSASAGRTLRKLLNEPIVDALRSEWETISDDLQRIASEYDLATSPSGDSGE